MDKFVEMMDFGEILIELENGFSLEQFIEVKELKEVIKEIIFEEEDVVV